MRRRRALSSGRVQVLGGIALAVAFPMVARVLLFGGMLDDPQMLNSALAIASSVIAGFWLLRRVSTLPGVQVGAGIVPSFGISFGVLGFGILLARIDYTRSLLLAGFVITIVWFYILHAYNGSREILRIGLVSGGNVDELTHLSQVRYRVLSLEEEPTGLQAIAADFRADHSERWEARMADYALAGIPVYHSKDLHESLSGRSNLEHLSENNLGGLRPLAAYMQIKLVLDILLAIPAILVLSPFLLITAIAIKLDGPGPVLFSQLRFGLGGKHFRVYKFRTMAVTLEGSEGASRDSFITQSNDHRITRVGRVLRRSRIDELPQIFNILRGEMSWIGPRPEALPLAEWYEAELPFYRYRHIVRPGITGWAQVNQGHVAQIHEIRTKLQYDFFYIRNISIWLDLVIFFRTVRTIVTGFGSR